MGCRLLLDGVSDLEGGPSKAWCAPGVLGFVCEKICRLVGVSFLVCTTAVHSSALGRKLYCFFSENYLRAEKKECLTACCFVSPLLLVVLTGRCGWPCAEKKIEPQKSRVCSHCYIHTYLCLLGSGRGSRAASALILTLLWGVWLAILLKAPPPLFAPALSCSVLSCLCCVPVGCYRPSGFCPLL